MDSGIKIFYFSNNSTKSVQEYAITLQNFGISTHPNQIMISTIATLKYVKSLNIVKNIYIIGEQGLITSFQEAGYSVYTSILLEEQIKSIDAVVVGMYRQLTYQKLTMALQSLAKGAHFIGTNPDPTFPTEKGIAPGAGAIIGALSHAIGRQPEIICGKPDPLMAKILIEENNLHQKHTIIIGDRVTTDLNFAKNAKIRGILVKTGFGEEEYVKYPNFPYYKVLDKITDLVEP